MRRGGSGATLLAQSPEDDFGFVYQETAGLGRFEARCLTDGAVHVHHRAAGAAHQVMMVVSDACFETRG